MIRFATERGAGVNVNTNAVMLSPEVALRFIKAGLSRLHISLDTSNKDLQNYLLNGERFDQVLEGIYNVQLARDLIGVSYPVIHTNCVLTNRNLDLFPELFAFILEKHKQTVDQEDPFYNDLFPHVIPVGGSSNDDLRPTKAEFKKFYKEIWPEVTRMWDRYQEKFGVPENKRGVLFGYFSNPFLRVKHQGGLDAYATVSSEGRYGKLALPKYCYVAPTQASFTPDGNQYRCGSHAIRHLLPMGNIKNKSVFENIKAGLSGHDALPQEEYCYGCALATLYINQYAEIQLKGNLKSMLEK
ncbi:MAG: radical SAM protein [Deltaproteobacteria bacterium]|nr:radical SAM protein [Deltaproteobacteria bacterium]